jgi:hypothetical protein
MSTRIQIPAEACVKGFYRGDGTSTESLTIEGRQFKTENAEIKQDDFGSMVYRTS